MSLPFTSVSCFLCVIFCSSFFLWFKFNSEYVRFAFLCLFLSFLLPSHSSFSRHPHLFLYNYLLTSLFFSLSFSLPTLFPPLPIPTSSYPPPHPFPSHSPPHQAFPGRDSLTYDEADGGEQRGQPRGVIGRRVGKRVQDMNVQDAVALDEADDPEVDDAGS